MYNEFLRANPDREAAIWADPATGEYVVVQGEISGLSNDFFKEKGLAGRGWKIIEHFHPGEGQMSRFASGDDFQVMRYLKTQGAEPPGSDSTRIRWYNPETKDYEYTSIGYDVDNPSKPYWISYIDYNGNPQFERFADDPWKAGSDYQTFLDKQRAQRR
jgi:hypothetical protein